MRFDVEIVESERLTSIGKIKLADIFYNKDYIDGAAYFNKTFLQGESVFSGTKFDIARDFKGLSGIDSSKFTSFISDQSDFSLKRVIIKRGGIIPFIGAGIANFHRYKASMSNNNVRMLFDYNSDFDRFDIAVPDNIDNGSILIYTSKLISGGLDTDNEYHYVDGTVNIEVVDGLANVPAIANRGTLIIVKDNGISTHLFGAIHSTSVKELVPNGDIVNGTSSDNWESIKSDIAFTEGKVYIDNINKRIFIKGASSIYNLAHKLAFKKSNKDYKYLIEDDAYSGKRVLYLNTGSKLYTQNVSIQINSNQSKTFFLEKFPVKNINFSLPQDITYSYFDGAVVSIRNNSASAVNINTSLSYNIFPVISFNRKIWGKASDIRHLKADISPKSLNFTDGTICMFSSDGDKSNIINEVELIYDNKTLEPFSSKKITARIKNIDGLPILNKNIKLAIPSNLSESIRWGESDSNEIDGTTNISGEFSTSLLNVSSKIGSYIEKEWVGAVTAISASGANRTAGTLNKIFLPFEIQTTDPNKVALFFVLGDDPLIGQIKSKGGDFGIADFSLPPPYDYYTSEGSLDSYVISGRKIAYVGLSAVNQGTSLYKVSSTFIRPTSISIVNASRDFYCKNLFLYDTQLYKFGKASGSYSSITSPLIQTNFTYVSGANVIIAQPVSAWNQNWLLTDNQWEYFKCSVPKYTEITYQADIPGITDKNVLGYFLRIDKEDVYFSVEASAIDKSYDTLTTISVSGFKAESISVSGESFSLATDQSRSINSYIGPYSYLNISDYLIMPEGTNYTRYICKYSQNTANNNQNRCAHPQIAYANYYVKAPDASTNLYCMHNIEYDKNPTVFDVSNQKRPCPALDAQLINPFVLYTS